MEEKEIIKKLVVKSFSNAKLNRQDKEVCLKVGFKNRQRLSQPNMQWLVAECRLKS